MQTSQKRRDSRRKPTHTTTINEHLLNCCKWNMAQGQREDDHNTEHLPGIVQHAQNA